VYDLNAVDLDDERYLELDIIHPIRMVRLTFTAPSKPKAHPHPFSMIRGDGRLDPNS
jgi:hypothetical protein